MTYDKEALKTDTAWLEDQGMETEEIEKFITYLITQGFCMTKKEYVDFIKEVKG